MRGLKDDLLEEAQRELIKVVFLFYPLFPFLSFFLSGQGEYLQDVWSQHLREHILCLPKSRQTKRAQGEKEESVHEERGETKSEKVKVFMKILSAKSRPRFDPQSWCWAKRLHDANRV